MKLNKLNFLFFLFFILFFCFLSSHFAIANDIEKRGLEIKYPIINGIEITTSTTISEYAVYIFSFSMIIGAIVAFAVLIFGGFRYLTSAGNPLAMGEARKWIWGAILGLILLFCSWLIIGIINKEILQLEVPEVKAISGIYLVAKNDEKIPYTMDVANSIPEYFELDYIEFISDKPASLSYADPNKDELYSVFVYPEKNLGGKPEEIKNEGAGTTHNISKIGSMFLLWWKEGIYIYDKESFETDSLHPELYQTSQANLKDWDQEKIKSLRIVNVGSEDTSSGPQGPYPSPQTPGGSYYVVLFQKPNFNKDDRGGCAFTITNENNFSGDYYEQIRDTISSIMLFKTKEIHGEVIFYDEISQKVDKKAYPVEFTGAVAKGVTREKSELDIWNSIAINANATVIISTSEEGIHKGYCMPFERFSTDGDILESTTVYNRCFDAQGCEEYFPQYAFIIPAQE